MNFVLKFRKIELNTNLKNNFKNDPKKDLGQIKIYFQTFFTSLDQPARCNKNSS